MTTVVFVADAEQQLHSIVEWWEAHRPAAASLVRDELERCVRLLEHSPDAGGSFQRSKVPGVRRLLMRETKHFVYYVHDSHNAVVYIIAVWGAPKLGDPPIHDPR